MRKRDFAAGTTVGGFAILLGLESAGFGLPGAIAAAFFAFAGSLEPLFSESLSISGEAIPPAGVASDALGILPAVETLPMDVLGPLSVFIGVVALGALVGEWKSDD